MFHNPIFRGCVIVCLFLFGLYHSVDGVMLKLSDQYLADNADVVIVGKVSGVEIKKDPSISRVNNLRFTLSEDGSFDSSIETFVSIDVWEKLKGSLGNNLLTLVVPGGFIPGFGGMSISDYPQVSKGLVGIFFLKKDSKDRFILVGLEQGLFQLPGTTRPLVFRMSEEIINRTRLLEVVS